jgi:hypothetical protein
MSSLRRVRSQALPVRQISALSLTLAVVLEERKERPIKKHDLLYVTMREKNPKMGEMLSGDIIIRNASLVPHIFTPTTSSKLSRHAVKPDNFYCHVILRSSSVGYV